MLYKRPKQRITDEFKFLNKFLDSGYFDKFNNNNFTLIQEPFTEVGFADLVCVSWRKPLNDFWTENRNKLTKDDIKILHHLYNCSLFKSSEEIVRELGFSEREVEKILFRLYDANLIVENVNKNRVKIKPLRDIFFIREIIAIEAKLKDWKGALRQSLNNISFASKSFSLLPETTINKHLLDYYKRTDVGLLSFNSTCREVVKPKRSKIPTNITSWYFNEYVGRSMYSSC